MTTCDWRVSAENCATSITFHLSALQHSFLIALASKRQIWRTKAGMQGVIMAVRLAQERLSAAAPAGAQVEMKLRRRWEPARTWKLEGIFGGGRAKESHNINFLTLAEGKFSCERHCGSLRNTRDIQRAVNESVPAFNRQRHIGA